MTDMTIGIIGDFNAKNATHVATNEAIEHAAASLGKTIGVKWLPTNEPQEFGKFQGLFCSPGSPYQSTEGALEGIQCARENQIPFLGTCGGMQHLVIEYARNVLGMREAAHAETDPYASCLFITPLSCSLVGKSMDVKLKPGTKAAEIYQRASATEKYYCNFGLNPEYAKDLVEAGLVVSGVDEDGEVRILEVPGNPFYVGTLFVPQTSSEMGRPHPVVLEFCRAAAGESALS